MVINGEVSTDKRQDRVSLFQRTLGYDVMLLSPKAGGAGLTLTAANHAFRSFGLDTIEDVQILDAPAQEMGIADLRRVTQGRYGIFAGQSTE